MPKATNVGQSTLTRRQIEVLEAVYATGNPYQRKTGDKALPQFVKLPYSGNATAATRRIIDELAARRYLTGHMDTALTVKGLKALQDDRQAMRWIALAEIASRIAKRTQVEEQEAEERRVAGERHEAEVAERKAESIKQRGAKLRELFADTKTQALLKFDPNKGVVLNATDEQLYELGDRIADIANVY